MTSEHHDDNRTNLARILRQLGWLDEGQSIHEARVPEPLRARYHQLFPDFATPFADLPALPSPATQASGEEYAVRVTTGSVSTPEPGTLGVPEAETPAPEQKKRSRKMCRGLTRAGQPCRAYRMFGGDLCAFHNAKALNEQQWHDAAEQFDPEAVAHARTAAIDLELLPLTIHDNDSFIAVSEGILRMGFSGAIPESILGPSARILRMVQRALPGREESRATPSQDEHKERVEQVIHAAPAIRDRLDKRDLHRRDLDIEDAGRTRESILKVNRKYASPAAAPSKAGRLRSMLAY